MLHHHLLHDSLCQHALQFSHWSPDTQGQRAVTQTTHETALCCRLPNDGLQELAMVWTQKRPSPQWVTRLGQHQLHPMEHLAMYVSSTVCRSQLCTRDGTGPAWCRMPCITLPKNRVQRCVQRQLDQCQTAGEAPIAVILLLQIWFMPGLG